jgi:hypothetical protein
MAPADVVKAGAAAGLTFSRNLVYEVRARLKNRPKKKGPKTPRARVASAPRATKRAATAQRAHRTSAGPARAASASQEQAFLMSALEVGMGRARELLDELDRRIEALVRG